MRFLTTFLTSTLPLASLFAAPPEVAVVRPVEREIKDEMTFVGRTDASTTVEIRARDNGLVDKVLFKEGTMVKRGDVLFQFDDRIRKAELDKAQAEVALAEAKLKGAEADFQRATKLAAMKVITEEELAKLRTVVDEAKAGALASRASLEVAKLKLEGTRIAAPIDGRIGLAHVAAGTIVKEGETLLATIIVADPLYVYFEVDDRSLLRLTKLGKDAKPSVVVVPGGDNKTSYDATIDFVDNKVNVSNNTIRVRATLPNPKGELVPGLYAKVRVAFGPSRKALCVPKTAIYGSDDVSNVLVVNEKNVLVERKVKVGPAVGDLRAIEEGVKADDRIVRYRDGRKAGDEIKIRAEKSPAPSKDDGGGAARPRPLPDLSGTGPALVVTANYPGANARVVEEVVAGPIAEQINGMEGLVHRFHSCTDDGEMRMTLLLKKGADLNVAQVVAQNRIATALPALPEEVRRLGLTVRKRGVHLASVAVFSPDGSRDRDFIEAFANKRLRDELLRVPGVNDAAFYADTSPQPRLRLDIDKDRLAALGLTTEDVTRAIQKDVVLTPHIALADSAKTPDELRKIVIKTVGDGVPIRVGDVATFEQVVERDTLTSLNGKPCVLLLVSAIADADRTKVMKDLQTNLKEFAGKLPSGVTFKVVDGGE